MRTVLPSFSLPLLSLIALTGCAPEGEHPLPVTSTSDGYVIEGELPEGIDLDALLAELPPGGFAVVADPGSDRLATITAAWSPFARIASGEFSVAVAAACIDCGDATCASNQRTLTLSLIQDTGPNGQPYRARTTSTRNFVPAAISPDGWTSAVGSRVDLSTTGTLPTCAPFSHYFDVVVDPIVLYTEDFDALPNSPPNGSSNAATFLAALPGWNFHNNNGARRLGAGSSNSGAIYSFGSVQSTDRALGGVASNATGTQTFGFCYTHNLPHSVSQLNLAYVGEQWRDTDNASIQSLRVDVSVAPSVAAGLFTPATFTAAPTADPEAGWSTVGALAFHGPKANGAAAVSLDGNHPSNQAAISASPFNGTLQPGDSLCVRFVDANDSGNDHGLGIDDLVLTGVPNP